MMNPKAALILATLLVPAGFAQAGSIYDASAHYTSFADSPFAAQSGSSTFWMEDFEDGVLDTLLVTANNGFAKNPGAATDSVDGDDGSIDGYGTAGRSWAYQNPAGSSVKFTFNGANLGALPTFGGLVWTDGNPQAQVTMTAFNADGDVIEQFVTVLGDGLHNGSCEADRFLGFTLDEGMAALQISTDLGSIELDHLQFGYTVVPLPPAFGAGLAGLGLVALRRRRASRR